MFSNPVSIVEFSLLTVAVVFSLLLLLRAAAQSNRKLPFSERACMLVLRFASWLECTGTAWDAGILRYRMERRAVSIELESTAERMRAATFPWCETCESYHSLSNTCGTLDAGLSAAERDFKP